MNRKAIALSIPFFVLALIGANNALDTTGTISVTGNVVDGSGNPVRGATVTAFNDDLAASISVVSAEDGSFRFDALPGADYRYRSRLMGLEDSHIAAGSTTPLAFVMPPAKDLDAQRPANNLLDLLKFEDEADALNFRMMCTYCHQVGTLGWRSPEEPVDWEVMITRMDGFRGLYKHTQDSLVDRLVSVYGRDAEKSWPAFVPPEPPSGDSLKVEISEWAMSKEDAATVHDLEVGIDGLIYAVDMSNDALLTLDPKTGERKTYSWPGGKTFGEPVAPIKGPHSIEMAANGDMWVTLALSGEMSKFDIRTKEFTTVSAHPTRARGGYPHTLRLDKQGVVWWTDAARSVFSLQPDTLVVKEYVLPSADQVRGEGARGESRGITPYGLDIAPDGMVWYTKLNGQRVGRIDPTAADGSPDQIVEWKPPVHGPRRLHVAPNGIVWVPGWASGDFAAFDPKTEEWKVYDMPKGPNSLPYALNVHPDTGDIWICGTGTDSMLRFDPKTETFTEYLMPTRVTYTREIEFDEDGNVWTCNSNGPTRHIENHYGSLIKIALK